MFLKNKAWNSQNIIAYFPIILSNDYIGHRKLTLDKIKYNAIDTQSIDHGILWQNTQLLIYITVKYRASLMSLLFGDLKRRDPFTF